MATLIKHRNQYCSKIQKLCNGKRIVTKIPLRTNKKNIAVVRHHKVNQAENHIKSGIIQKNQFKGFFEWLNTEGTSKLAQLTVDEAGNQFVNSHRVNISESSIKRIIISLDRAYDVWNGSTPIAHISIDHIESFKSEYKGKHSPCGINLNLRNIKTFLRWCYDRQLIASVPKIKMMRDNIMADEQGDEIFSTLLNRGFIL